MKIEFRRGMILTAASVVRENVSSSEKLPHSKWHHKSDQHNPTTGPARASR